MLEKGRRAEGVSRGALWETVSGSGVWEWWIERKSSLGEKLLNSSKTGFGIGKEMWRERDEATEKREWDFGRGERCQNHVLQATCFPCFYLEKTNIFLLYKHGTQLHLKGFPELILNSEKSFSDMSKSCPKVGLKKVYGLAMVIIRFLIGSQPMNIGRLENQETEPSGGPVEPGHRVGGLPHDLLVL